MMILYSIPTSNGGTVGRSVSCAGDVNNDGIDDVIIGAPQASPNGKNNAGISYVVFGSNEEFTPSLELSSLNGSNGFAINGSAANDASGTFVSFAGDVNGDGIDDVITGAPQASPNGLGASGSSYVIFGSNSDFTPTVELSLLNGKNGFAINGGENVDFSGISLSNAGDINGDGIDDVIIGADRADPNGLTDAGISYVVFGSNEGFAPNIELTSLNGSNGFTINGEDENDRSGVSVSGAGDINGDGIDDVIIGAWFAGIAGSSYVVFGSNVDFTPSFELSSLDGNNGFKINGAAPTDLSGRSVKYAGDVNADGIDDLIIGAYGGFPGGNLRAGTSHVVFGKKDTIFKNGFET